MYMTLNVYFLKRCGKPNQTHGVKFLTPEPSTTPGARSPAYVVTADDVDKLISVVCWPENNQGRKGEKVRLFANEQNKVKCDPEMQQEIDKYMSVCQASFSVLLLMDSSQEWEKVTLSLERSSYQIEVDQTQDIFIHEEYSSGLSVSKIKFPCVT
ncbi:hypothetical protein OSB04_013187 [Centaurea solstitialis]|uniref:Uncharacterized protein n=1 Tax=Centaurea solstitialis TaxID=347529 RepID=A0AA38TKB5_9ASTR|nr:hypothetical protein OSB04_013187 [Centaurea solstitialis]